MVVQFSRSTTEGQRNKGGVSRSLGGRDDSRSQSSTTRRWIPPSTLRRDALTQDDQHDFTFRKIRGLLNKLTPETFEKLNNDLLNIGLNSRAILGGLILLIFQKALDEPKYCSMYAQLCKRLSEEAPNFEPPDSACTFNLCLLQQCQEEFERRRRSKESYSEDGVRLSPDEEEQRQIARRKMVGNLRFIGELGKLEVVRKRILYDCIEELLQKSRRSSGDLAEDLECVCQIIRTSGRVLDIPDAKDLMDQYFARIEQLSDSPKLALRIRFMLQDILDLRAAGWRPRKIAQTDGPRTITEVREEAARDLGVYIPPPTSSTNYQPTSIVSPLNAVPTFFSQNENGRTGMEDVFGLPLMEATPLGTGPGVISTQPDSFPSYTASTNGYGAPRGDSVFRGRSNQQNYQPTNNYYQNKHFTNSFTRQQGTSYQQPNNQQSYNNKEGSKELPPRFKKMFVGGERGGGGQMSMVHSMSSGQEHVSLRPSGMSLKPKTPGLLPQSALANQNSGSSDKSERHISSHYPTVQLPNPKPGNMAPPLHKEPIIIKTAPEGKANKGKREKQISKAEYMKRVREVIKGVSAKGGNSSTEQNGAVDRTEAACEAFKGLKLPERLMAEAAQTTLSAAVSNHNALHMIVNLRKQGVLTHDKLWDGVRGLLSDMEAADNPKGPVAEVLAKLVTAEALSLSDLAELMTGGAYFPLYLLLLQCVQRVAGKQALTDLFNKSKVNLLNLVPESDRTKEKLSDILEDRQLSFLIPLLRIQSELRAGLEKDPSPHAFFKFIKDTLDAKHHTAPAFVNALMTVLIKGIVADSTLAEGLDPTVNPDKNLADKEKELLERYKPVLQAFLHNHTDLQTTAIYALQVFMYSNKFPKGMLLRWFVYLYDLEIVEEEAFLAWKEDVNDDYPGKGKALFQVNQWLTWLQTTEEDEEEEQEGE